MRSLSRKNGVISKGHKSQHKGSSLAIDGTMNIKGLKGFTWINSVDPYINPTSYLQTRDRKWNTEEVKSHGPATRNYEPKCTEYWSPAPRLQLPRQQEKPGTSQVVGWLRVCLPAWGHGSDPAPREAPRALRATEPCTATAEPACALKSQLHKKGRRSEKPELPN